MTRQTLVNQIFAKKSFLCIGLDSDISRLPRHLLDLEDPVFEFNRQIIAATQDICVAYKPNLAFYEALGPKGWLTLEKTLTLIPETHFTIADAKRGDIGNTSIQYARAFFEVLQFDALTIAPYMGEDSVSPFIGFEGKWAIVIALTSNKGSSDFQFMENNEGTVLYERVIQRAMEWGSPENLMFVVGATHPEKFEEIRRIAPDHFFLVPGIGAQGGDLESICRFGMTKDVGLIVNSSREIIFAGTGEDFAQKAREAALKVQKQMAQVIDTLNRYSK